jgi:hypothetical protein
VTPDYFDDVPKDVSLWVRQVYSAQLRGYIGDVKVGQTDIDVSIIKAPSRIHVGKSRTDHLGCIMARCQFVRDECPDLITRKVKGRMLTLTPL